MVAEERKQELKEASRALGAKNAAKKKASSCPDYTIDQLLDKTQQLIDEFQYELAQKFCQRALEKDPDNVRALETSGILLLELGNVEAAKQCFGRAVEVCPESGFSKYMYLGQIFQGAQAVDCFQKGIELMLKEKGEKETQEVAAACRGSNEGPSDRDISNAYCSVAELYLTDLCCEEGAEERCEENVEKAVSLDPNNPEALQLKASFLLSKEKLDEAKEIIKHSVSLWLPQLQAEDKCEGDDEEFDPVESCPLSYNTRMQSAKILIEVGEYELATEILELLLDEDEDVPDVWYMLGWANYLQGPDFVVNARHYLTKAKKVYTKGEHEDEELLQHVTELLQELGPGDGEEESEPEGNGEELEIESFR
ncbi:hypothetical protein C0Q70_09747 [Pomacea canaliculata]|uniref:Assembly chaperone of rpl4 n=1 Tax=Pomacea canaliculata TaxID=400727 RepID=A0A2T7PAP4_POMCA|nr:hypothetical protein C0Q70_09747 [Pomacea canaliculata]